VGREDVPHGTEDAQNDSLRLRPLRSDDEYAFRDAHRAMEADGFTFGLGLWPGMTWDSYLTALEEQRVGVNLPNGWVASTFLLATVASEIIGRTSIRHRLTETLEREGGHIGFGVLPRHCRRGYGIEILRQSLVVAHEVSVTSVMVTCDESNVGSRKVIESCGGLLESVVPASSGSSAIRRYRFG
jgi:predicted acetyltransferase